MTAGNGAKTTMKQSVGLRADKLADPRSGSDIPVIFLYPTTSVSAPTQLGPYQLDVAADGEPAVNVSGVILISHGSGSTPLVYRNLGWALAQAGYLVAMPEHPGNNRNDNSLADSSENLFNRPRHLSVVLDYLEGSARSGALGRVIVIGHSMGGYTGLAIAGGRPQTSAGDAVATVADPRIGGLVLLAPATPWFAQPGALRDIHIPVMLRTAEHDPHTPDWQADIVREGLSPDSLLDDQQVANAGHYSFLSVFPAAMAQPGFAPAQDPPGFNRSAYEPRLAAEVLEFVAGVLAGDGSPGSSR
jgi:predicted dienelactone hydrolase